MCWLHNSRGELEGSGWPSFEKGPAAREDSTAELKIFIDFKNWMLLRVIQRMERKNREL